MSNEPSKLYIPPSAELLSSSPSQPIRLGLQGYPGKGKTTSALTAPNPIVLNLDNKLGAHIKKEIPVVHFWQKGVYAVPTEHKHEAVLRWLLQEGPKLSPEQTLILDSWGTLMNWFDLIEGKVVHLTNNGKENEFKFWKIKQEFAMSVCEAIKALKCNSITTFHETVERDDDGVKIIGIRPMMQGRYADQLAGQFTCWFAQHVIPKQDSAKKDIPGEFEYVWQIKSDKVRSCFLTTPKQPPKDLMFVPANWSFFETLQ